MKNFYLIIFNFIVLSSLAKTTTWTGVANTTAWATITNWDNGVPAAGDSVIIDKTTSRNPVYNVANLTIDYLEIKASNQLTYSASSRILTISGNCDNYSTLTIAGTLNVGGNLHNYLGGTFTVSGTGTCIITGDFINNSSASNSKTLTIMGSFEHNSLFAFANSSTLNIQGDLTGTGNVNSSGTVNFNSTTSNQLISVQSFSTSILILNNTKAGGGVVTIQTSLDITNTLTLTQGNLYIDNANNGELNVNLESAIINQTGTGSVSGNVTFVRTISAPKSHYLSPILDNVTMQQIHDQYQVINPVTNLTRMHQYTNGTWTPVNNLSTVLDKDGAYSLYLLQSDLDNNSNTIFITGTYTHARTKTFNFADNSSTKYYLVPNIYPNTLLWGSTSKTKLTGKIYYWDPTQTAYQTYNANTGTGSLGGTNNVGALQAFFVETDGTGGTASLTQLTSHVGTTSTAIRKTTAITPNNQFKLIVTNTITGSKDELIVHFNDDGKIVYDNYLDAIKFMNPSPTPNLYVKKATNNLVMSNYPSLNSQSDTTIQLYVKTANADNYKFEILPLGNVDPYLKITLRDSLNNYQQDILANTSYTFKGGINKTMILGLNIGSLSKTSVTTDIVQATSFYNNETITVQTNKSLGGTTNVSIYNTTGALVTQYTNVDLSSGRNEISNSNLSTGIYLMKIENKDFVTTHKLVVE